MQPIPNGPVPPVPACRGACRGNPTFPPLSLGGYGPGRHGRSFEGYGPLRRTLCLAPDLSKGELSRISLISRFFFGEPPIVNGHQSLSEHHPLNKLSERFRRHLSSAD